MIRSLVFGHGNGQARTAEPGEVRRLLVDEQALVWLDLDKPTPDELQRVAEAFGFHPLAVEDATKQHQRPKIDPYDTFYFIVFYDIDYNEATGRIDEHELDIFLGRNYLVTVHYETIDEIDEVADRFASNQLLIERGVGVLLYSLLDTIVDHYLLVAERIRTGIEGIERRVFSAEGRQRQALLEDIFALRQELLTLRLVLGPERDVLATLERRELPIISKKAGAYFRDVQEHLLRVVDVVDVYRDLLSSVLDSYHSSLSHQLNQTVRLMTAWSIILMSMTLIAGIYGMNFNPEASPFNMPELNAYLGYPLTLLAMLLLGAGLALYFKRRGWL